MKYQDEISNRNKSIHTCDESKSKETNDEVKIENK